MIKKLFSNPRFTHLAYGSIILILGLYIAMSFTTKHEYQSVFESMSESEKMYEIQNKDFLETILSNSAKYRFFKENGEEALKVHK